MIYHTSAIGVQKGMSVDFIILGLLNEPSTGYQIKRDFDEIFNNFWAAEQSQIYRTLKSLESQGLLRSREATSTRGPARRLYTRTGAGRKALLRWLACDAEIGDLRIPYLAQLFFMDRIDDLEQTERVLTKVRDHFASRLEAFRSLENAWQADDAHFPDFESSGDFHAHLVMRHGISRAEATLAWAQTALARTRARRDGEAS